MSEIDELRREVAELKREVRSMKSVPYSDYHLLRFLGQNVKTDGTPTFAKLSIDDATYFLDIISDKPYLNFDTNDYLRYDRVNNYYQFRINATDKLYIYATSIKMAVDLQLSTGILKIKETTTPGASGGYGKVYTKNDNKLYFQDGAGTEHEVAFV